MRKVYAGLTSKPILIIAVFVIAFLVCFVCDNLVSVNYEIADYLPDNTASTVSLELLTAEFDGGIPNARVMVTNVTIPEALEYKEKLKQVEGVSAVTWLDDTTDITVPLSTMDPQTLETYYKQQAALFTVTIDESKDTAAVAAIRNIVGENGALTGKAVSNADTTVNTVTEINKITAISIAFVFIILLLTTTSWIEPIIVLIGLGMAIILNKGTNLIFGEISFVTNAAGSVLLLAVSLDYSVFLLHRFHECLKTNTDTKTALVTALCKSTSSIVSSGLTTIIGFLALALMQFKIGPDLGLALAKGILISLITVFMFMPSLILCTYKLIVKTYHKPLISSAQKLGKFIGKITIAAACIFVLIIVPAFLGSNSNSYLYGTSEIFGAGTQYGKDTAAVKEIFGQSDTYVLMFPKGDTATEKALSDQLHTLPEVTSIISYVDMAGAEIPNAYLDAQTLAQLEGNTYGRMVLTVDVPYEGEHAFNLIETIRKIAEEYYPGNNYLAGGGVSTYDLMLTITDDMIKVNLIAIIAVFLVLLFTMRSLSLPFILVLSIETAIWLNLSVPYFSNQPLYYLAYLIISAVQLGATVDYAILMANRYCENRRNMDKKATLIQTISDVFVSIITSGSVMIIVGFLMGWISSNGLLAQLGMLIGRGAIFSLIIILFVLPGMLYICDLRIIRKIQSER